MFNRSQLVINALRGAEKLRKNLNISPLDIIDPVEIAQKTGCNVWYKDIDSLEGMYALEPKPTIIIGSNRPSGRKNFTCAHELGHHYFKHGTKLDQFVSSEYNANDSEEFLVDCFAGFLLMPKRLVLNILSLNKIEPNQITDLQIYKLSSIFGVGYGTILNHFTYSLSILTVKQLKDLCKNTPKNIKSKFGIEQGDMILFDSTWPNKPIDMQIGDIIISPTDYNIENSLLELYKECSNENLRYWKAIKPGYSRISNDKSAANVRISKKDYVGMARYRFLKDED